MKNVCIALFIAAIPYSAIAHEARPMTVHVTEQAEGELTVDWRVPVSELLMEPPSVWIEGPCEASDAVISIGQGVATFYKQAYTCTGPIAGATVHLDFGPINPGVFTLIRVQLQSGENHTALVPPGETEYIIPEAEDRWGIARDYTVMGILHIWEGVDHLLFVLCLLFIARTFKRTVTTITGFTIAHSITLVATTLGWVHLPVPAVEASIALSVAVVAAEIARGRYNTLTYRYPVTVSSTFGLLHGFGFASVLREIGLPQTELPMALLTFNIGVEIGQIVFVAALFILLIIVTRITNAKDGHIPLERTAAYIAGSIAAYWTIERITGFVA